MLLIRHPFTRLRQLVRSSVLLARPLGSGSRSWAVLGGGLRNRRIGRLEVWKSGGLGAFWGLLRGCGWVVTRGGEATLQEHEHPSALFLTVGHIFFDSRHDPSLFFFPFLFYVFLYYERAHARTHARPHDVHDRNLSFRFNFASGRQGGLRTYVLLLFFLLYSMYWYFLSRSCQSHR